MALLLEELHDVEQLLYYHFVRLLHWQVGLHEVIDLFSKGC